MLAAWSTKGQPWPGMLSMILTHGQIKKGWEAFRSATLKAEELSMDGFEQESKTGCFIVQNNLPLNLYSDLADLQGIKGHYSCHEMKV